ncbi:hypothetical protein MLD38_033792 [Melastoma candidum]|uniref:Uncharacterized protein n=1 Tax=Melastoma candidum TaxID=119954 RepID=A0ACB9MBP1_9MYRT|nr:hypothetical protein MLD38_033792 [Melastoma candidum]
MELADHPALGFLRVNGGFTPPRRQVSDLSSLDSYGGGYEEPEHQLHHPAEMGKATNPGKTEDVRGNINGLVQKSRSGSGSSFLSFQGKTYGRGASSFMWRDQEDAGCFEPNGEGFGSLLRGNMRNSPLVGGSSNHGGWLYSDATVADSIQESDEACRRGITAMQKRPHNMVESSPAPNKKQCMSGANKSSPSSSSKQKPKTASPSASTSSSKDPQSVAAKNRRERISERLKILQDLVPNGNKVDLVTMLEKAISYVKFLQLQVKVLATDEFWPAQGGKAPDIAQVKEAIDAILSSQRSDTSSTSK